MPAAQRGAFECALLVHGGSWAVTAGLWPFLCCRNASDFFLGQRSIDGSCDFVWGYLQSFPRLSARKIALRNWLGPEGSLSGIASLGGQAFGEEVEVMISTQRVPQGCRRADPAWTRMLLTLNSVIGN